jgi:hypothetical protein
LTVTGKWAAEGIAAPSPACVHAAAATRLAIAFGIGFREAAEGRTTKEWQLTLSLVGRRLSQLRRRPAIAAAGTRPAARR